MLSYDNIMWVYVNMKKSKNKSTETKTSKRAAKRVVKSYSGVEKFKKFMKRYWYWPVTLVVLLGVSLGWCYGLGFFDEPVELIYSGPETIDLYVNSYYNVGVKASNGEDVNYYVADGFEDIISVDSLGKVYGKKNGIAELIAEVGNIKKSIYVNVNVYTIKWVLQIGDIITNEVLEYGLGKYINEINGAIVTNLAKETEEENKSDNIKIVLEPYEDLKSRYNSGYKVINEGQAILTLLSNNNEVCEAIIYAYKSLEEKQRQFDKEIPIYEIYAPFDITKIEQTVEINIGEEYRILPISFEGTGHIFYHSSNPGVLNVHQDGSIMGYGEGTTIVSIFCTGDNNIANYKIHVKVPEITFSRVDGEGISRDVNIGDIIKESELREFYGVERLYEYRTNSNAFNVYYDENGEKCFEAVKLTDTQDAFIIAYDINGIAVFKFKVNIIEKPEDE